MRRKLFVLIIALIMLFSAACSQSRVRGAESSISKMGDIKNVKVTVAKANVREGCSDNSSVLQSTDKNVVMDVISKVANWYAVKLPDNKIGFLKEDECTPVVKDGGKGTPVTPSTGADETEGDRTGGTGTQPPGQGGIGTTPPGPNDGNNGGLGPGMNPDWNPDQNAPGTGGGEPQIPDETGATQTTLTDEEQEMLRLVNEARAQNNVPALKIDLELTNVARIKSQDMIDNNYFSHNSPTYGSPFDMMKDFGIEYVRAGENLAGNRDVQSAQNALMNSPGHRKNILSPDYTHIGIGIKSGGQYGKMFVQMFISKPK
jgi:uncharacterized YkwD family protein